LHACLGVEIFHFDNFRINLRQPAIRESTGSARNFISKGILARVFIYSQTTECNTMKSDRYRVAFVLRYLWFGMSKNSLKTRSFFGGTYCRQLKYHSLKMKWAVQNFGLDRLRGRRKKNKIFSSVEQRALKNVINCLNTNIFSYLETSGGQSSNLCLNVVHFFNTSVN
jgi:hypothetical protein